MVPHDTELNVTPWLVVKLHELHHISVLLDVFLYYKLNCDFEVNGFR